MLLFTALSMPAVSGVVIAIAARPFVRSPPLEKSPGSRNKGKRRAARPVRTHELAPRDG